MSYFVRIVNFYLSGATYDTPPKSNYSEVDSDYYRWIILNPEKEVELIKLADKLNQVIKSHNPIK